MTKLELNAPDISCDHCKAAVAKDLCELPGVGEVVVDIAVKAVHTDYDDSVLSEEQLRAKPTAADHFPAA